MGNPNYRSTSGAKPTTQGSGGNGSSPNVASSQHSSAGGGNQPLSRPQDERTVITSASRQTGPPPNAPRAPRRDLEIAARHREMTGQSPGQTHPPASSSITPASAIPRDIPPGNITGTTASTAATGQQQFSRPHAPGKRVASSSHPGEAARPSKYQRGDEPSGGPLRKPGVYRHDARRVMTGKEYKSWLRSQDFKRRMAEQARQREGISAGPSGAGAEPQASTGTASLSTLPGIQSTGLQQPQAPVQQQREAQGFEAAQAAGVGGRQVGSQAQQQSQILHRQRQRDTEMQDLPQTTTPRSHSAASSQPLPTLSSPPRTWAQVARASSSLSSTPAHRLVIPIRHSSASSPPASSQGRSSSMIPAAMKASSRPDKATAGGAGMTTEQGVRDHRSDDEASFEARARALRAAGAIINPSEYPDEHAVGRFGFVRPGIDDVRAAAEGFLTAADAAIGRVEGAMRASPEEVAIYWHSSDSHINPDTQPEGDGSWNYVFRNAGRDFAAAYWTSVGRPNTSLQPDRLYRERQRIRQAGDTALDDALLLWIPDDHLRNEAGAGEAIVMSGALPSSSPSSMHSSPPVIGGSPAPRRPRHPRPPSPDDFIRDAPSGSARQAQGPQVSVRDHPRQPHAAAGLAATATTAGAGRGRGRGRSSSGLGVLSIEDRQEWEDEVALLLAEGAIINPTSRPVAVGRWGWVVERLDREHARRLGAFTIDEVLNARSNQILDPSERLPGIFFMPEDDYLNPDIHPDIAGHWEFNTDDDHLRAQQVFRESGHYQEFLHREVRPSDVWAVREAGLSDGHLIDLVYVVDQPAIPDVTPPGGSDSLFVPYESRRSQSLQPPGHDQDLFARSEHSYAPTDEYEDEVDQVETEHDENVSALGEDDEAAEEPAGNTDEDDDIKFRLFSANEQRSREAMGMGDFIINDKVWVIKRDCPYHELPNQLRDVRVINRNSHANSSRDTRALRKENHLLGDTFFDLMYGPGSKQFWDEKASIATGGVSDTGFKSVSLSQKTPVKLYETSPQYRKIHNFTKPLPGDPDKRVCLLIIRGFDGFITSKVLWRAFRQFFQGEGVNRRSIEICFYLDTALRGSREGGFTAVVTLDDILDSRSPTDFIKYIRRRWRFLTKARNADLGVRSQVRGDLAHTTYQHTHGRNEVRGIRSLVRWAEKKEQIYPAFRWPKIMDLFLERQEYFNVKNLIYSRRKYAERVAAARAKLLLPQRQFSSGPTSKPSVVQSSMPSSPVGPTTTQHQTKQMPTGTKEHPIGFAELPSSSLSMLESDSEEETRPGQVRAESQEGAELHEEDSDLEMEGRTE